MPSETDRLNKAAGEFKRLEKQIEKLQLKVSALELKSDSQREAILKRYELIAEVCKGLLSIVNKEIGELTKVKK